MRKLSCVIWTIIRLKRNGIKIPNTYKNYNLDSNDFIMKNEKELKQKKEWYDFFKSIFEETITPKNYDIIAHQTGAGFFMNNQMFTLDEFGSEVLAPLPSNPTYYKVL